MVSGYLVEVAKSRKERQIPFSFDEEESEKMPLSSLLPNLKNYATIVID